MTTFWHEFVVKYYNLKKKIHFLYFVTHSLGGTKIQTDRKENTETVTLLKIFKRIFESFFVLCLKYTVGEKRIQQNAIYGVKLS